MSNEFMAEFERLLSLFDIAWLFGDKADREEARAALLAHIQRGAVPESDDGKRVLREVFALCEDTETKCSDETGDFARGRRFEAKGIARAIGAWYQEEFCGRTRMGEPAAPAPDQFRDAAKMMADTEDNGFDLLHDRPHTEMPGCRGAKSLKVRAPADEPCDVVGHCVAETHCKTACKLRSSAPAEVLMPKPVAYGFGNTAITGHTNRLMMVRIDIPGGDQYAGAFWLPLVLADEAHTYGIACRAAGEAAGYARGLRDAVRDADIEALRLYVRALCKAVDAATDFAGKVAGGASWWDDVWADHAAALDRARERISQAALRGEVKP